MINIKFIFYSTYHKTAKSHIRQNRGDNQIYSTHYIIPINAIQPIETHTHQLQSIIAIHESRSIMDISSYPILRVKQNNEDYCKDYLTVKQNSILFV